MCKIEASICKQKDLLKSTMQDRIGEFSLVLNIVNVGIKFRLQN